MVRISDEGEEIVREMPPIARTLADWRRLKRSLGVGDLLAIA
jgi:hypothetical protein